MKSGYTFWNSTGGIVSPNSHGVYVNATRCEVNDWVNHENTQIQILYNVLSLAFGLAITFYTIFTLKKKPESKADIDEKSAPLLQVPKPQIADFDADFIPEIFTDPKFIFLLLFQILVEYACGVFRSTYITKQVTVTERAAMSSANIWLRPIGSIFGFFEDGMQVKAGTIMGSKDWQLAGILMKWGIFGGFISGVVAVCGSYALLIPPVFALLVPQILRSLARPYWIIHSFQWIFKFMNESITGFYLGVNAINFYVWNGVFEDLTSIVILWTMFRYTTIAHSTSMALQAVASSVLLFATTLIFFGRKKYSDMFGLKKKNMFSKRGKTVAREAARDGVHLMSKRLIGNLQGSIGGYVAQGIGIATQYQFGILGSIGGVFGTFYASMLSQVVGIAGVQYFGARCYRKFKYLVIMNIIGVSVLGLISFGLVYVFRSGLSYYYSSNELCTWAEDESTIDTYNSIFENIDTEIMLVGLFSFISCIASVSNQVLYIVQDFKFLRNFAFVCFICVELPAMAICYFKYRTTFGLFIAQRAVGVVQSIVYTVRVVFIILPNIKSIAESRNIYKKPSKRRNSMMVLEECRKNSIMELENIRRNSVLISRE